MATLPFPKPFRLAVAGLAVLALGACSSLVPERRPGASSPASSSSNRPTRTAAPFINPSPVAQACLAELGRAQVDFSPLPDQYFGGGCSQINSVALMSAGSYGPEFGNRSLAVSNVSAVTCPMARTFAGWAQYGAAPAARQILGSELVRIETYGSYSCRKIAGSSKLSEHAHANAIDVSAFVLADGRRVSVKEGWDGSRSERRFLTAVHDSACKRFGTILGPGYNSAHHDHFHLDMSGSGFCR